MPTLHFQTDPLAIVFKALGLSPNMILALAGVYGTLTFVANCITTKYLADQWGRRKSVNARCIFQPLLLTRSG